MMLGGTDNCVRLNYDHHTPSVTNVYSVTKWSGRIYNRLSGGYQLYKDVIQWISFNLLRFRNIQCISCY